MATVLGQKALLLLTAIILLTSISLAEGVYEVQGEQGLDNDLDILYYNQTSVDEVHLDLSNPEKENSTLEMGQTEDYFETTLDSELLDEKGVYQFNFIIDDEPLVEGFYTFEINSQNNTWLDRHAPLASGRPVNEDDPDDPEPYCFEEGDYSCEYEPFQADMMMNNYYGFITTGSTEYLDSALIFATSPIGGELIRTQCDHAEDDFDCQSSESGSFTFTGVERQSSLIEAYWSIYRITGDSEVRDLAISYTEGIPEECNVWENDYDCGNSDNQSLMSSSFWTAYEKSGNNNYKDIAINLTDESENYTSPQGISTLSKAYIHTGNNSYRTKIDDNFETLIEDCEDSCDRMKNAKLSKAGLDAYRATNNKYYYRRSQILGQDQEEECLTNADLSCNMTDKQRTYSSLSANIFLTRKDMEKRFFDPNIIESPNEDRILEVEISTEGLVESPKATIVNENTDTEICSLDNPAESCEIDFTSLPEDVYYLNFEEEQLNYLDGDGLPLPYSRIRPELEDFTRTLAESSPDSWCDPWDEDYSCIRTNPEIDQTHYISGFSAASNLFSREEDYKNNLIQLASPEFHIDEPYSSSNLCIPDEEYSNYLEDEDIDRNQFSCVTRSDTGSSQTQGSYITSLFSAYQTTRNQSLYDLGSTYAETSVDEDSDCQVWDSESDNQFNCSTNEGQAEMIQGYWTAYEVTGREEYHGIAYNLSKTAIESPTDSKTLITSLWNSYSYTNENDFKEKAENNTENIIDNSDCPDCSFETYTNSIDLYSEAYLVSRNSTYLRELNETLSYREEQFNDDESACELSGTCDSPSEQGSTMSVLSTATSILPSDQDFEITLDVAEENLFLDESTTGICTFENTADTDLQVENMVLNSSDKEVLNVTPEELNDQLLSSGENLTLTSDFNASSIGESDINCDVETPEEDISRSSTVNIEEEEEEEEETDDSEPSSSPSPSTGGPSDLEEEEGDEEFEPVTETFEYENKSSSWEELNLSIEKEFKSFYTRENCLKANRTHYEHYSELLITQECYDSAEIYLDDDNIAEEDRVIEIEGEEVLNYSQGYNDTEWDRPVPYFMEEREIDVELVDSDNISENTSEEFQQISYDVGADVTCTLEQNGVLIDEYRSSTISENISLVEGENEIILECGDQSEDFSIMFEEEDEEPLINTNIVLLASLFLVTSTMVLKRQKISFYYHKGLFGFYFKLFKRAIEKENVLKGIKYYKKMSKHYQDNNISDKLLSNDLKMLSGIKMFIMSEMLAEHGESITSNTKTQIRIQLNQYITNNSNGKVAEEIKNNLNKIN